MTTRVYVNGRLLADDEYRLEGRGIVRLVGDHMPRFVRVEIIGDEIRLFFDVDPVSDLGQSLTSDSDDGIDIRSEEKERDR